MIILYVFRNLIASRLFTVTFVWSCKALPRNDLSARCFSCSTYDGPTDGRIPRASLTKVGAEPGYAQR